MQRIGIALIAGLMLTHGMISSATAQGLSSRVGKERQAGGEQLQRRSLGSYTGVQGIAIAPGVTLSGNGSLGIGYDSNPDSLVDESGSAFGLVGVALNLTAISERSAVSVSGYGNLVQLFDDEFDQDRSIAGADVNGVFSLMPGLALSYGATYTRDHEDPVRENRYGAFAELVRTDEKSLAFLRGRYIVQDYLNTLTILPSVPALLRPLFDTENFDYNRADVTAGIIVYKNRPVAFYVEGHAADIDFVNEIAPALIHRDAEDYYAKAGIRVTFSPALQMDLGGRFNFRDFKDSRYDNYDAGDFDALVRWIPSRYFNATFAYDRTFGEGATALALMEDIRAYTIGFNYVPIYGTTVSFAGSRERIREVGDVARFEKHVVNLGIAHDLVPGTQLFAQSKYEHTELDRVDVDYERFRFMVGIRRALGAKEAPATVSLKDGTVPVLADHGSWHYPSGATLRFDTGYMWAFLPETRMTTVVGGAFFDEVIGRVKDHDGKVDGPSFTIGLDDFASYTAFDHLYMLFSAEARFARLEGKHTSSCNFTATTDCLYVNIDDFDISSENNTGPFGTFVTTTDRTVYIWDARIEANIGKVGYPAYSTKDAPIVAGSLKDAPVVAPPAPPFKVGLALKGLKQKTRLHAIDTSVPDPVDYRERLDSYYGGAYVGYENHFSTWFGWSLGFDWRGGMYWARSEYEGRYVAYVPVGGTTFVLERGALDDTRDHGSFITDATLSLDRNFGWGTFSVFGQGEYISHAPTVKLNNDDEAGGSPFGVIGSQVGTQIELEDAYAVTVGARVSIPLP